LRSFTGFTLSTNHDYVTFVQTKWHKKMTLVMLKMVTVMHIKTWLTAISHYKL